MFVWPEPRTDFVPLVNPDDADQQHRWYFVFDGPEILQHFDEAGQWQPVTQLPEGEPRQTDVLGIFGDIAAFAVDMPIDGDKAGLRSLFGKTDHMMFSLAGRAQQVLDWWRTHRFCGRCGQPTREHEADRAMVCDDCGIHAYPRLSPSIITLVHKGDEVLLARNHRFPTGMYSTLAGFVEPGESIERTLIREVAEEVGVKVHNLEYLGSQPWPFPNSLMLGFLAEYESGEIVCQEEEIADAQWFSLRDLPQIPGKVAISRWLIDSYLARQGYPVED